MQSSEFRAPILENCTRRTGVERVNGVDDAPIHIDLVNALQQINELGKTIMHPYMSTLLTRYIQSSLKQSGNRHLQ